MSYRIAGIDVHKKMLAVVVCDVSIESEYEFERRKFSSSPEQLRSLAAWLLERDAQEVPVKVRSNTASEPIGVSSGRGTYQVVQSRVRSAGPQCAADAEGDR